MHLVYTHFKYGNTNYIPGSSASCRPALLSPSTSITTPLRRDSPMMPASFSSSGVNSYWPVTPPMAQALCLCEARRFVCYYRAFLALVTPTLCAQINTAFLFSTSPTRTSSHWVKFYFLAFLTAFGMLSVMNQY